MVARQQAAPNRRPGAPPCYGEPDNTSPHHLDTSRLHRSLESTRLTVPKQAETSPTATAKRFAAPAWFLLFVGAVCAWVLSLPVFPTQDGPMHRYYTHALGAVMAHDARYAVYAIRHPFPPYGTQYLALLGLARLFPYALAEKLLTCAEILCFAFGLRFAATAIGPAGAWVSLLVVPLLLPWYLMMGFYNYAIGLGLALLALGFWLRIDRGPAPAFGFAAMAALLSFSHPMPLGLLAALAAGDLARRAAFPEDGGASFWARNKRQLPALAFLAALCILPSFTLDRQQNSASLRDIGLHLPFVRTALLLAGVSPYNTRSHGLWTNGYRLALYSLLLFVSALAFQSTRASFRARRLSPGGACALGALLVALLLPFLPDHVNGGVYFALRSLILIWVFAMLGAAGAPAGKKLQTMCVSLGAVFTVLTLLPAERSFRPLARSVAGMEAQPLPERKPAFLLSGPMLGLTLRERYDIMFDPFLWANALALVKADGVALDAPWLTLPSFPLRAAPGALLVADAFPLIDSITHDPTPRAAAVLPGEPVEQLVRASDIVTYAGTPEELRYGIVNFLGEREAGQFRCRPAASWSMLCVRTRRDP